MKIAINGILESVKKGDKATFQDYMTEYRNKCLELWVEMSYDELENLIYMLEQNFARVERILGSVSEREALFYQAGIMQGILQIFRQLLREEVRDEDVAKLAASQSVKTDKILLCLYEHDGGMGMRHGELAQAVEVSSSALANMMKPILRSGAVECSCVGMDLCYTLSKTGIRYCKANFKV